MNTRTLGIVLAFTLVALSRQPAHAAGAANDNGAPPPHGPPPEAVEACANQSEGAACTVTLHGRSMQGKCVKGPDAEKPLACMPPPPPEAVEACANQSEGAACTVAHRGRDMQGTCRKAPNGEGPLACMSSRPPRP